MEKTKNELKSIAVIALLNEYGFAPLKKDVALLEASGDGTYILFDVNGFEYRFSSHMLANGVIWCGKGTIEQIGGYRG